MYQCARCNKNYKLEELQGTPGRTRYYFCSVPFGCHGNFKMYDRLGRLCGIRVETGRVELIDKKHPRLELVGAVDVTLLKPYKPIGILFAVWN